MPRRRSLIGQLPLPNLSCENPDDADYWLRQAIDQAADPELPRDQRHQLFTQYARHLHQPRYRKLCAAFASNPSSPPELLRITAIQTPEALFQNPVLPLMLLEDPAFLSTFTDGFFYNLSRARTADLLYRYAGTMAGEVDILPSEIVLSFRSRSNPLGKRLRYFSNGFLQEVDWERRDRHHRWWTVRKFGAALTSQWVSQWLQARQAATGVSVWAPLTWPEIAYIVRELPYGSYLKATDRTEAAPPGVCDRRESCSPA